ncbi:lectin [Actinoplanes sp. SE50]|uniref:L-type lectin-domain containing protein n=1 Tax=unclassified Actinoplanes TaxID=2626549 RepID=UPI00023ED330|nr:MULTISPECIES: L-type lectin-domain containing protein [unclassified Actinoplanes]AEV87858.1 Seed lectin [Actinoplanes sp. SE50/110]ATO86260.1 lectin [Actinoplanes sp. SE50]SLM03675.1 lectin [Actinoplanes sp. SE50/110]
MSRSHFSRLIRAGLAGSVALTLAAITTPTGAFAAGADTPVDFPNFNGSSRMLDRNGTADILVAGRRHQRILRLTAGGYEQTGSAWALPKFDLTSSFETAFRVYLHHGRPGADGIAFLIQGVGPHALGGWGGGLGYRGIKKSVAVEFDTFQNTSDPSSNHLAVVLNGDPEHHMAAADPSIPLYGRPFNARITYNADAHELKAYVKSLRAGTTEELVLDESIDLTAETGVDAAWLGFTGSTGTALSKQDIYSWSVQGTKS